jgi:hypothetical protein
MAIVRGGAAMTRRKGELKERPLIRLTERGFLSECERE